MLFQAFASTVLVNLQGKPWQPSSFPTFVITACCPFSEPLDEAANLALHRSLQNRLQKLPGVSMEEVIGQSPDGSWQELSWAVAGISEQQAIDLGMLHYQWAIFRFDGNRRAIIDCWKAGRWQRELEEYVDSAGDTIVDHDGYELRQSGGLSPKASAIAIAQL